MNTLANEAFNSKQGPMALFGSDFLPDSIAAWK